MTAEPPAGAPLGDADAVLGTIDLTGGAEGTPIASVGRVIGGLLLLIIGGVGALALLAAYIGGDFIPGFSDWHELLGDGLLYGAIIAFVIAVTGFELVRRSRKSRRAAEAARAATIVQQLDAAGVYDGTSTPQSIAQAMGEPLDEDPSGITPTKPPISGPTLT